MLRRITLPLLLLLFLGGALDNAGSDTALEQRVAQLERMLGGENEIPSIRVKTLRVSESVEVANPLNRVVVTASQVSLSSRNPEISELQLEEAEKALGKMGETADENVEEALRLIGIRGDAWCNSIELSSLATPVAIMPPMVKIDSCASDWVSLTPQRVHVASLDADAAAFLHADHLHVMGPEHFRINVGVAHVYSEDGSKQKTSAAKITFFNSDGTVMSEMP